MTGPKLKSKPDPIKPIKQSKSTKLEELKHTTLHADYKNSITKIPTETTKADIATLKKTSVEDIRTKPSLLTKKTTHKSIKEESLRRLNAYTTYSDGYFTLNYEKMGKDDSGYSHEDYIGLGDIFISPQAETLAIKKMGQEKEIIVTRAIITSGKHRGRIGYIDDNNEYVPTFTGDQVRIVTYKKENKPSKFTKSLKHILQYKKESINREIAPLKSKRPTLEDTPITPIKYIEGAQIEKNINGTTYTINEETIRAAELECKTKLRNSNDIDALSQRKAFIMLVKFIGAEYGVDYRAILGMPRRENGFKFDPNALFDGKSTKGFGHMLASRFNSAKNQDEFKHIMRQLVENPNLLTRGSSILSDLASIAGLIKISAEKLGIDPSNLTLDELAALRADYHYPFIGTKLANGEITVHQIPSITHYQSKKRGRVPVNGQNLYNKYMAYARYCISLTDKV